MTKKDIHPRIPNYMLKLQNYDYTTEHREGKLMAHVDCFSRMSMVCLVKDNSFESNLVIAQTRDRNIVKIRDKLEKFNSIYSDN